MRIAINLDGQLLEQVESAAHARGQSLAEFVTGVLRDAVPAAREPKGRMPLGTFKGNGVFPGVDLTNWSALLDVMEEGLDVTKRR